MIVSLSPAESRAAAISLSRVLSSGSERSALESLATISDSTWGHWLVAATTHSKVEESSRAV